MLIFGVKKCACAIFHIFCKSVYYNIYICLPNCIYASTFLCNLLFCKYAKIISDCFANAHPIISINIECDNKQNIKTNPVLKKLYEVCLFNYHKDSQHTAVSMKYCVNLFKVYNHFNTARKCDFFLFLWQF